MVPLSPSTRRSLKSPGWYTPSASPIRVSVIPQRSSSRYQSALLDGRRETSSPSTMPAWPRATSAGCRLSVVFDLSRTRLADIDERGTAQVSGLDFGIIHVPARAPPRFGAAIRSTPKRLIRIRYPPVRCFSPSRQSPWPAPAQDAKTPRNIAPRADEGPEKSPFPGRGLTGLTAQEPGSAVPLDEKGRLKSLFPPHSTVCLVSTENRT